MSTPEITVFESQQLIDLRARLASLEETFVPTVDPTVPLVGADYDRLCAYVVLSHAEFEEYFEVASIQVVAENLDAWLADGQPRTTLMSLLSYSPHSAKPPPEERELGAAHLREALADARERHYRYASLDNHGIGERYLLALLLPAGLREIDFDSRWLQSVADLAHMRGQVAHHSSTAPLTAKTPIDAGDAIKAVKGILGGLARLDCRLEELRTEIPRRVVSPATKPKRFLP